VLGLTVASAILLNSVLLRARLAPMEQLVESMTQVNLQRPGVRAETPRRSAREVHELTEAFNRMLARLEDERRNAGRACCARRSRSAPGSPRTCTTRSTRR
jgi:two-component system sensor histidine kinase UhpB